MDDRNEARPASAPPARLGDRGWVSRAAELAFGGLAIFMGLLVLASRLRGESAHPHLAVFLVATMNLSASLVSRRTRHKSIVELLRATVGAVLVASTLALTSYSFSVWWPAFMVLVLGSALGLGLHVRRPSWTRLTVASYVVVYSVTAVVRSGSSADWLQLSSHLAVTALVSFVLVEVATLLGATLQQLSDRSHDLHAARRALFAEVEVAQEIQKQEHERTLELRAARDSLFAEMAVAQEIQTLLLPKTPQLPGCEVVGRMVPASEVGGDYYDVVESNGRRFLAIGDVSGHGLTSGLAMMMASTTLIGALESSPRATLPELYKVLNRCVRRNFARMDLKLYMTFLLLEHRGDGHFVAVGRHLPILVYRRASSAVEAIEIDGIWLGIMDELDVEQLGERHIHLDPGDQLFLYTDGIVEQFASGEMFGFERLQSIFKREAEQGADGVVSAVLEACRSFSSQQDDDVTMLVVRREDGAVVRSITSGTSRRSQEVPTLAGAEGYGRTETITSNGPDTTRVPVNPSCSRVRR